METKTAPKTPTAPRKRWHKALWIVLTALFAAGILIVQFLPADTQTPLIMEGITLMCTVFRLLLGDLAGLFDSMEWMRFFLYAGALAVPTWFAWLAACERREDGKKALLPALYVGGLLSLLGGVVLPVIRYGNFVLTDLLFMLSGVVGMTVLLFVCVTLSREIVDYVIFGVLTTIVNLVTFNLCDLWFLMATWLSTSIAWVTAVIFAYVTNKLFVFHSETHGVTELLREAGMFFGARALTYLIDLGGMILLVDILSMTGGFAKILCNIIVLILNYVFSKLFVFKKGTAAKEEK